jgi:hypothetical protein
MTRIITLLDSTPGRREPRRDLLENIRALNPRKRTSRPRQHFDFFFEAASQSLLHFFQIIM